MAVLQSLISLWKTEEGKKEQKLLLQNGVFVFGHSSKYLACSRLSGSEYDRKSESPLFQWSTLTESLGQFCENFATTRGINPLALRPMRLLITCGTNYWMLIGWDRGNFFLNHEGTFGNQEGMITWYWLAEHGYIKLVSRFKRILKLSNRTCSRAIIILPHFRGHST